jgi:tRNA-2-methylthio-N6-dimethylallyladenosine synthase
MRQSRAPETFRVKSFGCQMNVYDGERMAELLADKGMRAAPEGEDADLVVLNTCHIREKAAEKVYSDIGRLVKAGGESPPMIASPAASRRPRARRSWPARRGSAWWWGRRPITGCPN